MVEIGVVCCCGDGGDSCRDCCGDGGDSCSLLL